MLFRRGITVRNQSVLIRGVNDDADTMTLLVKRLVVDQRAPVLRLHARPGEGRRGDADLDPDRVDIEKAVRGTTAGFNTPLFICDAPGGGGKRDVHSFEYYDRENGIAVYSAPSVKPGESFLYFDPIDTLSPEAQARWAVPELQDG